MVGNIMSDEASDLSTGGKGRLSTAVKTLPGWKRKLFALSIVLSVIGLGAQASSKLLTKQAPDETASHVDNTGRSDAAIPRGNFLPGGDTAVAVETPAPEPTLTQRLAPWVSRIGLSFFVGLSVGLIFRTFLKTMAIIAAIAACVFLGLSYFDILNVDLTSARSGYETASAWLSDQASRLTDVLLDRIPSAGTGSLGFLLGFKKK